MPRKLNDIEVFFVKEHRNLTAVEIAEKIPEADLLEIQALLEHLKGTTTTAKTEIRDVNNADQFIAGNLMARQKGVTIMTPAASELADVRKKSGDYSSKNKDVIHTIKSK